MLNQLIRPGDRYYREDHFVEGVGNNFREVTILEQGEIDTIWRVLFKYFYMTSKRVIIGPTERYELHITTGEVLDYYNKLYLL